MEGQRRAARLHQISVERDCRSGTANPEARRQVEGKPEPNRAGAKRSSKRIGKTQHSREPRHESPGGGSLSRGSHDKVRMLLPSRVLRVTCPAQIAKEKCGERGRNRTYNLLIKSYVSRCGCSIDNCSRHNNLKIKRPAWTVSEKRWKSWRNRTTSNCEGHKKDTAPGQILIGGSMGLRSADQSFVGQDQEEMHC